MTLDQAQDAFNVAPSNKTAADYLETLLEYEKDDMIGRDTFLDGLITIADYLRGPV